MTIPLLSLAAGNLPEFSAEEVVNAASSAGWEAAGVWFEAESWSPATTTQIRNAFERTGLVPLDIEVLWIHPGPANPDHERLLAAGGEIGARNALIVSSDPELDNTKRRFDALCQTADRFNLNLCLEFLPITEVKTLGQALDVVQSVDHPRGKVLVDALHLIRSGGAVEDLHKVPPSLMSYAQPCDAHIALPEIGDNPVLREAVDGRYLLGEGELPLEEFFGALPDNLPLSPEIRSLYLRERYPTATERAEAILKNLHRYLSQHRS